jgi:hypothetical protein
MKSLEHEGSSASFLVGEKFHSNFIFDASLFIEDFNCSQATVYLANLQVQIRKYSCIHLLIIFFCDKI